MGPNLNPRLPLLYIAFYMFIPMLFFVVQLEMGFRLNSYSGPAWAGFTDITHLHLIVMIPLGRSHTENPEGYTPDRALPHPVAARIT